MKIKISNCNCVDLCVKFTMSHISKKINDQIKICNKELQEDIEKTKLLSKRIETNKSKIIGAERAHNINELVTSESQNERSLIALYSPTQNIFGKNDKLTKELLEYHFYPPEEFNTIDTVNIPINVCEPGYELYKKYPSVPKIQIIRTNQSYRSYLTNRWVTDYGYRYNANTDGLSSQNCMRKSVKFKPNYACSENLPRHIPSLDTRPEMKSYNKYFGILVSSNDWKYHLTNQAKQRLSEKIFDDVTKKPFEIYWAGGIVYEIPAILYCWKEKPELEKGIEEPDRKKSR